MTAPLKSTPSSPVSNGTTPVADEWIRTGPSTIEWQGYCIRRGCAGDPGHTESTYYAYSPSGGFLGVVGGDVEHAKQLCHAHADRCAISGPESLP